MTSTIQDIISILQFHDSPVSLPVDMFPQDENINYKFGVLDVSTPESSIIPYTWDIKFDVDCSGSMSDPCMDGRSKIDHIKHVLCNIIRLFNTYRNITINVCIEAFDDKLLPLFDFITITDDNLEASIAKIKSIYPRGQTNLLLPITRTREQMEQRSLEYPSHKQLHFLLTDGVDTMGNSAQQIQNNINSQYETIVFGFGIDHDSTTLMGIGKKPRCEYAFIAELEKAGIVYGEFIHNVFYRTITSLTILLYNAEIYCWKTNTWNTSIVIGNIASGLQKSYYIRTTGEIDNVRGEIHGIKCSADSDETYEQLDYFDVLPSLQSVDGIIETTDLSEHSFRYKTLELLHEVSHLEPNEEEFCAVFRHHRPRNHNSNGHIVLKKKLNDLYKKITSYKTAKYGEDSCQFLTSLMDDIYVARRSLEIENGRLYVSARQTSQGNQNVYTPSNIDDMDNTNQINKLPRYNMFFEPSILRHCVNATDNEIHETDELLDHNISHLTQDVYSSPRMLEIIRSTSDGADEETPTTP